MTADLGFIGLFIWSTTIAVTIASLLRPKWKRTKDVSAYLFLMFLPVLTGSMFLTLLANKLAWSIVGLAAALQVPSWGARYKGYFAPKGSEVTAAGETSGRLARWDLKVSQRFRVWVFVGAVAGAVLFGATSAAITSVRHVASMSVVVPKLDAPPGLRTFPLSFRRVQSLHTLLLSDAYAVELQALSGVDVPFDTLADRIDVIRPHTGIYLDITYTDDDASTTQAVGPHLIEALEALIEDGHLATEDVLADEFRPRNPGEQNYYTGPMFIPVSADVSFRSEVPRKDVAGVHRIPDRRHGCRGHGPAPAAPSESQQRRQSPARCGTATLDPRRTERPSERFDGRPVRPGGGHRIRSHRRSSSGLVGCSWPPRSTIGPRWCWPWAWPPAWPLPGSGWCLSMPRWIALSCRTVSQPVCGPA